MSSAFLQVVLQKGTGESAYLCVCMSVCERVYVCECVCVFVGMCVCV